MENIYEREHIEKLRPYLSECCVLLKSDGAFPLDSPCRIACCGSGASGTVKCGTGSGEVNSRYFVSINEALSDSGFVITNPGWHKKYMSFVKRSERDHKKEIRRIAAEDKTNVIMAAMGLAPKAPEYDIEPDLGADAAIYVLSRICGEGSDRRDEKGDFRLTDSEVRDINALDRAYDRFMLIINTGGPVDLTPVMGVRNILLLSQLGVETGRAAADILLGRANPSGKLASTWAAYKDYCADGDFGDPDDTMYKEGIYVGYRYFDAAGKKPLFPFGFGLSYTSFEIKPESCGCSGAHISARLRVTNTGERAGKEVVQVYLSAPSGRLDRELRSLAAFAKTAELEPGESEELELGFELTDHTAYDEENECYILEKGDYTVLAGSSSVELEALKTFRLAEDKVVRRVRNAFAKPSFKDSVWQEYKKEEKYDAADPEISELDLSGVVTETVCYDRELRSRAFLEGLSDSELVLLNTGSFDPKGGLLSMLAGPSTKVPGAAGESSSLLRRRGIDSLVLADGPAGLRLAREYYVDEKGAHSLGTYVPESLLELMPAPARLVLGRNRRPGKNARIYEQYTTNIPIAAALAQSWNLGFAELCGDIAGREAELFNVDVWLAPALNIHRNVLCGRNFEYFSEDPLISGLFAAAITRGAQKHAAAVTIKHYAANNQEKNRYFSNSIVSERAIREIYLKGFELCVREGRPMSLMTSYNLLNGVHTSEHRGLIKDILRCEFGFDGLVMTDWVVASDQMAGKSKHAAANAARAAAAGNSLFMPGSKKDCRQMLEGLADGTLTRADLIENAVYLLELTEKLRRKQASGGESSGR